MRTSRALAVALLFVAGAAAAQDPGADPSQAADAPASAAGAPPATLIVYGDDPCPQSQGDEIVVCARQPEEERYRIPRPLRERRDRPLEVSWGSRVEELEEASRPQRPDSCSVVGSGGQTGCAAAAVRQWYQDRRARRSERARTP